MDLLVTFKNVLKFSDLVRDILVPTGVSDMQRQLAKVSVEKVSIDALEQSSLLFFNNYTQR